MSSRVLRFGFAGLCCALCLSATLSRIGSATTARLLGYEPATGNLVWIEQFNSCPGESDRVIARNMASRPWDAAETLAVGMPASRALAERLSRLVSLAPAPTYHVAIHAGLGAVDSVRIADRWMPRVRRSISIVDADRAGHIELETCGMCTGLVGLYRVPGDEREVAVVSFDAFRDTTCEPMQRPVVLANESPASERAGSVRTPPALPPPDDSLATLVGRVTTPGGGAVAFANVLLLGTRAGTTTDEAGWFTITGLPPGYCRLKVLAAGRASVLFDDSLSSGLNRARYVSMGPRKEVHYAGDVRDFAPCPTWFTVHPLQGDHALRRNDMLIDGDGPGGNAIVTTASGALAIDEGLEGCELTITWTPKTRRANSHVMVLDQRGSIVRDFGRVSSAKPVRFAWDGLDWRGQSLPAGSYVVQVVSGSDVAELECGRRSRRPLD